MAGGINHAKQIVIEEAEQLAKDAEVVAKDLQNGKAGDLNTISKAIALLVRSSTLHSKMIFSVYTAEFMTVEDCRKQHQDSSPVQTAIIGKRIELKAGPFEFKGNFSPQVFLAFISVCSISGLVLVVGKVQGWW